MTGRRHRNRHTRRGAGDRGIALVTTVWIALFMALTAATIATLARTDAAARRNAADFVQARELATSALHMAIADLAEPAATRRLPRDGSPAQFGLAGHTLTIRIEDERGKLDLRLAPRQHVEALFRSLAARVGDDSFAAVTLAQRVIADLQVQNPRDPRASAMQTLGSFATIPGMSPDLFASLLRHATVFGFGPEINPMTAAPETLAAIEGIGRRDIDAIMAAKAAGQPRPAAIAKAERWLTNLEGPIYTVIATGRLASGIEATTTTIVGSQGIGLARTTAQFSVLERR